MNVNDAYVLCIATSPETMAQQSVPEIAQAPSGRALPLCSNAVDVKTPISQFNVSTATNSDVITVRELCQLKACGCTMNNVGGQFVPDCPGDRARRENGIVELVQGRIGRQLQIVPKTSANRVAADPFTGAVHVLALNHHAIVQQQQTSFGGNYNGWATLATDGDDSPVQGLDGGEWWHQAYVDGQGNLKYRHESGRPQPGAAETFTPWEDLGSADLGFSVDAPAFGFDTDGTVEIFAVSQSGGLYHNRIKPSFSGGADTSSGWKSLPGGNSYWVPNTTPSVARNLDGRLEIFLRAKYSQGSDGAQMWHVWQTAPSSDSWTGGVELYPGIGDFYSDATVMPNADGRLQIWATTAYRDVYTLWQNPPPIRGSLASQPWHGPWTRVASSIAAASTNGSTPALNPMISGFQSRPSVAMNADGRLELFYAGGDPGTPVVLMHRWQVTPNGAWSPAVPVTSGSGNRIPIVADPQAFTNRNGMLEVFAFGTFTSCVSNLQQPCDNPLFGMGGSGTLVHTWYDPGYGWNDSTLFDSRTVTDF